MGRSGISSFHSVAGEVTPGEPPEIFSTYPDLLTPAHIAELTGFTVEYVRRLCREHKIPAVQVGGRQWFVPKPRFVEYVMGGGE